MNKGNIILDRQTNIVRTWFDIKKKKLNKNLENSQRYIAFTLAEVLITLGIIGIIASITIPTVIQKTQDYAIVSEAKKAYSILSQAYTLAVKDKGTPDTWGLSADSTGATNIMNALAPYLNITEKCYLEVGCFPQVTYKRIDGTTAWIDYYSNNTTVIKARLSDGTSIATVSYADCSTPYGTTTELQNVCGWIGVDVNGAKGPAKLGADYLSFYITKLGIVPMGGPQETSLRFDNTCISGSVLSNSGYGCTAWIIYNENLDYLYCPGSLSWSGTHKCN